MALDKDYSYTNAPLNEVIAEIRWKLTPLATVPGGGIDPYFLKFRDFFSTRMEKSGYGFKEPVVEPDVPLELIGGAPAIRFRPGAQQWPLLQVGPGLLTMNITPPYEGWKSFRPIVQMGLDRLMEFFGGEGQLFELAQLRLTYIDAFTAKHGFSGYSDFIRDHFHFLKPSSSKMWEALETSPDAVSIAGEASVAVKSPEHSTFVLRARPGTINNTEKAAIVDYGVVRATNLSWPADLMPWFDAAHVACRVAFENSISDALRDSFGQRVPL